LIKANTRNIKKDKIEEHDPSFREKYRTEYQYNKKRKREKSYHDFLGSRIDRISKTQSIKKTILRDAKRARTKTMVSPRSETK
jgi:hypothetical protein